MRLFIYSSIFIFLILIQVTYASAQFKVTGYIDAGHTNVSNGLFIKTSGLGSYQFGKNMVAAGMQLDLKNYNSNVFSGLNLIAAREARIKNFHFEFQAFYLLTLFSDISRETNWGMMLNLQPEHFKLVVGTSFRTFAYRKRAINEYNLNADDKIHENWNIIYSISYYLKRHENEWNIGVSVTNIDHYIINQETNPNFNLNGYYQMNAPLRLFAEVWYKSSGAFNLSVNYFGVFLRTGIVWDIG